MISEGITELVGNMIELRKDPDRLEGCPVWDKLSLDLWEGALNGDFGNDQEFQEEANVVMEHCKTCRHPMCIKALFGDAEPTVVESVEGRIADFRDKYGDERDNKV